MPDGVLITIATAGLLGAIGQTLASWLRLPAIIFLLLSSPQISAA